MKTPKRTGFSIVYFYDLGGATARLLPKLSHELSKANIVFLAPRHLKRSKTLSEWSKFLVKNCSIEASWTDFNHPIQILKFLIRRKAKILHMQWEFTLFRSYAFFSFTVLLFFLARFFLKTRIIVTMHPVMPSDESYQRFFLTNVLGMGRVRGSVAKLSLILLYQLLNITCSTIIVHTHVQRKWLLSYGIRSDKVKVVPYAPFIYQERREILKRLKKWVNFFKIRGLHDKKKVLYVGMFGKNRGLEELILALKMLKEAKHNVLLVLAGAPSLAKGQDFLSKLNSKITENSFGENVVFVGWIDDADMYALCSITDCFVLLYKLVMSASSKLSIITTYLPKMSIICTDHPILREQLNRHKRVHFVPLNFSSSDLAKALVETLNSPEQTVSRSEEILPSPLRETESKLWLLDLIDMYENAV